MHFLFLPSILILIWIILHNVKRSKRLSKESSDTFWENEAKANNTRKQDISGLNYISIDNTSLPYGISKQPNIIEIEDKIKSLSSKKILNLTGITNTELKSKYGVANLEELSSYDENFTLLVRLLHQWGNALYQNDYIDESKQVFEYAISIGSDITSTYCTLANIYIGQDSIESIDQLLDSASTLNSLSKSSIINKLNNIRDSY